VSIREIRGGPYLTTKGDPPMKKLIWWFRIVGVFYLLLALMNMYYPDC
jgi:hypothetical protein